MTLDEIANKHTADKGSVWHNYCLRYAPFFEKWRGQLINVLEMGVQFGCSAKVWLDYFPAAHIYGIDIAPQPDLSHPRWSFIQGSMTDPAALNLVPTCQIIIDDASHRASDSRAAFQILWPRLAPGGIYAIEDVHSWWDAEFLSPVSGPEWVKEMFGDVNWWGKQYHGKPRPNPNFSLNAFEQTVDFVQFTKGLIIIGKK